MPRLRADQIVKINVRAPVGYRAYWAIIRQKKEVSVNDFDARSRGHKGTIAEFLRRLVLGGYMARIEGTSPYRYRLLIDQPDAPRLQKDGSPAKEIGQGQDHMWRVMKMTSSFDATELAALASTNNVRVKASTATAYIRHLYRVGYLIRIKEPVNAGAGAKAVYRLKPSANTGPLAPQIQTTDWVWDPNIQKVVGPEGDQSC